MSLIFPSSMLGEWSLDTDLATGLSLGLLFRRLRKMMNAIMTARTTAPADETPTTRDFETLWLKVMDYSGVLVNAIGGPPVHSQYPILFWYAFPAD